MRVTTGKVIDGKVVVEGLPLEEGAIVTVLARESEETFRRLYLPRTRYFVYYRVKSFPVTVTLPRR